MLADEVQSLAGNESKDVDSIQSETVAAKDPDTTDQTSGGVIAIVSGDTVGNLPTNARVINLDDVEATADASESVLTEAPPPAVLFETLPALFRQYRDQRCSWEAGISSRHSANAYQLACKIALNRQQTLQLRQLLAEKIASDSGGESYRGYYLRSASGGNFQSCDRRQDWWVTGSDEVLQALERRYNDIASENFEIVYTELRGRKQASQRSGPGADFIATLEVVSVNLMRPILDQDCQPGFAGDTLNDSELAQFDDLPVDISSSLEGEIETAEKPGVTTEELGDAGFLYGYFGSWNSACAVDQMSVCRAQTQVEYSSEGEWQMVVDRSSNNSWRVRLIPVTDTHLIEGNIHWSIDNSDKIEVSASDDRIEINRGLLLASGTRAKSIVRRLRAGQTVDFEWLKSNQSSARLSFSLVGITRALRYFDQVEK